MSDAEHAENEHHEANHDAHYITIWKYLVGLLVLSVVGPMLENQVITLVTAFGIACVKAYMVVKHFMHLNLEKRFVAYFVATALAFMFLFYAGTSADVMNHSGRNWNNVAAKKEVERALKQIEDNKSHGHSH